MKFQKEVSHFKSLVFLVSCYDRAKFHHHLLQLSREFQHPRSSRAEETREESREKITMILGGWEKEGPSILRPSPRFLTARSLRKLFEATVSACNRHRGPRCRHYFPPPDPILESGRACPLRIVRDFLADPLALPEFLPRRTSILFARKKNVFWNEMELSMKICRRVKFITKGRDAILFKIV